MTDKDDVLANIAISLNHKGQFIFDITGDNDGAKQLAYVMINYIKNVSNIDPLVRNKFVFSGEDLPLLN